MRYCIEILDDVSYLLEMILIWLFLRHTAANHFRRVCVDWRGWTESMYILSFVLAANKRTTPQFEYRVESHKIRFTTVAYLNHNSWLTARSQQSDRLWIARIYCFCVVRIACTLELCYPVSLRWPWLFMIIRLFSLKSKSSLNWLCEYDRFRCLLTRDQEIHFRYFLPF